MSSGGYADNGRARLLGPQRAATDVELLMFSAWVAKDAVREDARLLVMTAADIGASWRAGLHSDLVEEAVINGVFAGRREMSVAAGMT